MLPSYQVVLWKQESFGVLRLLQIEFFRSLLGLSSISTKQLERMIDDAAWITYPLHLAVGILKMFVFVRILTTECISLLESAGVIDRL